MGYKIESFPKEKLIVETWGADYSPAVDGPQAARDIIKAMDALNEPVTVIVDMRAAQLSFNDILTLSQVAADKNAPARHPLQRRRIIVTDSNIVSMAAQGLDHEVFGHIMVDIATSMEEAWKMAQQ